MQNESACSAKIFRTDAAKAEDQFWGYGGNQADADGEGMVDTLDMLFGESADIALQAFLVNGTELFQKYDRGHLQATLGVDVVMSR